MAYSNWYDYSSLKENSCQYVKSLGNGEHLIYDYETNQLEIWANSKHFAGFALKWNNTHLEFCRSIDRDSIEFDVKLNEFFLHSDLPHGSGIDCKWEIEDMGKYFKCLNSFHCMNEHGMYCGYADFTLIIPKKNPLEFRLHFNGKDSAYLNERYMLRDYLEDTFHYAIDDLMNKLKRLGNK